MYFNDTYGELIPVRLGSYIGNCTVPVLVHGLVLNYLAIKLVVEKPTPCCVRSQAGSTQPSGKTYCI